MKFSKEILKGSLEVMILHILDESGEAYGYQIIKNLFEQSEQIFEIKETSLYPLLYRLESKDFIQSERKKAPNGKERRYYFLTEKGKKLLNSKREEFKFFFKGFKKILNLAV